MSKKKKKHQSSEIGRKVLMEMVDAKSKKSLNKEFKQALKEIEGYQFRIYEADKKKNKKNKKKINKKERDFYTNMESIKARKKISKEWEKTGFLDRVIKLLQEISPFVQLLAKGLAMLIIAFISIDAIKSIISPDVLSKLATVFDIAMSI